MPLLARELESSVNMEEREKRSKIQYCWDKFFTSEIVQNIPLHNDTDPCGLYELNIRNNNYEIDRETYMEQQDYFDLRTIKIMQKGIDRIIRFEENKCWLNL